MELHGRRLCDSSPAVANGVVYVGSDDGNVYALNAATGAELWSYTTEALSFPRPQWRMGWSISAARTATCTPSICRAGDKIAVANRR